MKLSQSSATFSEPLSLSDLRKHLRVEHNEEDSYLNMLIGASRAAAESLIDGIIADREFILTLDEFTNEIAFPLRPVNPNSIAISYVDENGDSQTFTAFDYTSDQFKTCIFPTYNTDWPKTEAGFNKVTITFSAGFVGHYGSMPQDVKHAMLMIAGTLYDQREDHTAQIKLHDVPTSSDMLLSPYKKVTL